MTATQPGSQGIEHGRVQTTDWLRIGAVLVLVPYHAARIFETPGGHVVLLVDGIR